MKDAEATPEEAYHTGNSVVVAEATGIIQMILDAKFGSTDISTTMEECSHLGSEEQQVLALMFRKA